MLSLPKILGISTAFFTIAHAHFTLDYPSTRGFDEVRLAFLVFHPAPTDTGRTVIDRT